MENINKTNISVWNTDKYFEQIISPNRGEVLSFCLQNITEDHPKDDYKEFIELVIIVLGETPLCGINIRQPGAYHMARWWQNVFTVSKYFYYDLNSK